MANSTRVRSASGTGTGTAPTATLASAPASGDLLIAYVKAAASTTLAAANGFTKSTDVVQSGTPGAIFWKVADGSETTTIQPCTVAASKTWGCVIDEWNNAAGFPASPVLSENGQVVASTASYTTQTLSPAAASGCIIAIGFFSTNAARTWSAEAVSGSNVGTVTEVGEQVSTALATASISTTTGSYSGSATLSVATNGGDSIVIFKPNQSSSQTISPSAIASAEAFGSDKLNLKLAPSGIASLQAFGTLQLNLKLAPTSIASLQAFGTHVLSPGPVSLSSAGIASLQAFGTQKLNLKVVPSGIASLQAFGAPTLIPGVATISPAGLASLEAFGTTVITLVGGLQTISPSAIASLEAFGAPKLSFTVFPTAIASLQAFGTATFTLYVRPSGIASAQAFGTAVLTAPPPSQAISPAGIASLQAFGTAKLSFKIFPSGIASAQAFGTTTLGLKILPSGIASAQAFGAPKLNLKIFPVGIASVNAFGALTVVPGVVVISPSGIVSLQAFGTPTLAFVGLDSPVFICMWGNGFCMWGGTSRIVMFSSTAHVADVVLSFDPGNNQRTLIVGREEHSRRGAVQRAEDQRVGLIGYAQGRRRGVVTRVER